MKGIRIAVLGLALVLGSTVAGAQGRGGGRGNPAMAGIDSTLSADQKAKMAEIVAKYAAETQAIRDLMATDRPGAMKKRAELTAKMAPEMRAILSAEQQIVWDKNQAAMKARADSIAKAAPPAP
jgi:hypothetical protein